MAERYDFSLDTPIEDLPKHILDIILYGTKGEKLQVTYSNSRGTGSYEYEFDGIINQVVEYLLNLAFVGIDERMPFGKKQVNGNML